MIGCTKLLCGKATVSEIINKEQEGRIPPHLLQFSTNYRPVVVWNVTNRCNLRCKHCYVGADSKNYPDELTTSQAKSLIEDLGQMGVPVLLFSGGEPLLRKDVFELAHYARKFGIRPVLSTNGILITWEMAQKIKKAGFQYVGVSIDGLEKTHNSFRQNENAFELALRGLEMARRCGLSTGVRFTITGENNKELERVLNLVEKRKIPRFCMYHLVYSGRGKGIISLDTTLQEKRKTIQNIITRIEKDGKDKPSLEILTVDNPADGVYIYHYIEKHKKEKKEEVLNLLKRAGGCSAGVKIASIDSQGNVHPCQFWGHLSLGNVKRQKFSKIWLNDDNELLCKLRAKKEYLKGKCGRCGFVDICGGCRIRAEIVYSDPWQEDPACYLSEEEIKR